MLKNKTAIITGASRGIGKAIALKFAKNNCFVGINYYSNKKAAEDTLKKIKRNGGSGILLKGDISNRNDVNNIVKRFLKESKNIDILINNNVIYFINSFEEKLHKTLNTVLSVNLTGSYNMCKEVLPYMKKNSRIIFISSQLAFRGSSHGSDYAASKAGQLGLMRSLAIELASKKILVNAVAPGTVDTDIISDYTKSQRKKRASEVPLKRLGNPKDIAGACLYLASDLSNYITGETINVNGGLYIH